MVRFATLSSGSNGNCCCISNGRESLLIDIGIGGRTVKKRLEVLGIDIASVSLVLVSHDHFDHIRSLGTFTMRFKRPVCAPLQVLDSLERHYCTAGCFAGCRRPLLLGEENDLGWVTVTPFEVPHDATFTVGYHIRLVEEDCRFTFLTDLGEVTDEAVRYASMADHLVVEANYDVDMLLRGHYPPELKRRIMSGNGHLSNEQTASLLKRSLHDSLRNVWLCHLSEQNNTPELALSVVRRALPHGSATTLSCLPRREAALFDLG